MLSGSRRNSTSVTKYPYVSPLPEASLRLECYWYVDESSRAGTIEVPFESIISVVNALLIHFPFCFPFFFPRAPCLCMSGWLPKAGMCDCSSPTPGGDNSDVFEGHAREYSFLSHIRSSSFLFSPHFLILSSARNDPRYARSPRCHEQVLYPRDISFPRLISILKTFSSRSFVRSRPYASPGPPLSFPTLLPEPLESLLRLFTNYRTHFHPSVVFRSRSESRSSISGENQLVPCVL